MLPYFFLVVHDVIFLFISTYIYLCNLIKSLIFCPVTKRSCMDHMTILTQNLQTSADELCIKSGTQNVLSVQIHRFCLKHFRGWTDPASTWSLLSSVFWLLVIILLIIVSSGYLLICRPCQLWSVVQPWQWVCIHLLWQDTHWYPSSRLNLCWHVHHWTSYCSSNHSQHIQISCKSS